jgi:hypothetical protein
MILTFANCTTSLTLTSNTLLLWANIDKVTLTVKKNDEVAFEKEIEQLDVSGGSFIVTTSEVSISEGVWEFIVMVEHPDKTVTYDKACSFLTCDNTLDNNVIQRVAEKDDLELMLRYYMLTATTCDCFCSSKVKIYNWIINRLKQC